MAVKDNNISVRHDILSKVVQVQMREDRLWEILKNDDVLTRMLLDMMDDENL